MGKVQQGLAPAEHFIKFRCYFSDFAHSQILESLFILVIFPAFAELVPSPLLNALATSPHVFRCC